MQSVNNPNYNQNLQTILDQAIKAYQGKNYIETEKLCQTILSSNPNHFTTLNLLAHVYFYQNDFAKATPVLEKALKLNPSHYQGCNKLGICYEKAGLTQKALQLFEIALEINPDFFDAHDNLGKLLGRLGKPSRAVGHLQRAYALNPDVSSDFLNDLGGMLVQLRRSSEGLPLIQKALEREPDNPHYILNMSVAYSSNKEMSKAKESIHKALQIKPEWSQAYMNLGFLHEFDNEIDEAIKAYEKSIEFNPEFMNAYWNLALVYLKTGQFEKGWEYFHARYHPKNSTRLFDISTTQNPLYQGEDVRDKTVLVYHEQGYGDTIQFIRYLPELVKISQKVLFRVQPPLEELIRNNLNTLGVELVSAKSTNSKESHTTLEHIDLGTLDFDVHLPLMDLPHYFWKGIEDVPLKEGYLKADPDKSEMYANRHIQASETFKIGLVWQGNFEHHFNDERSLFSEDIIRLFTSMQTGSFWDKLNLFSLIKEYDETEMKRLEEEYGIINLGNTFSDFSDTAAAIANLDLVISVDTSVAHLAGAMGKPCWIMLPFVNDWRWGMEGDKSYWYDSCRLFRQKEKNNWDSVFEPIMHQLETVMESRET